MKYFTGTKEEIENKCREVLTKEISDFIEEVLKMPHYESKIIAVLHKVQNKFKYLSQESMEAVAYLMKIPAAKISGLASFYHYFNLKPVGKYVISVCIGTACHVKGADKIIEKIKEEIGISLGDTTEDGLFSLEGTRCIGACALAPVMKIGDKVYSQVTADQIPKILEAYAQKELE